MNIRKLFALLAGVSMVANVVLPGLANAATPDTELGQAYEWAYSKSITTMPTYEAANMYGNITRAELAKMLSNWAMNVKGNTPDESAVCEFSDIDSVKGDLHDFIIKSCQLGLMGQNMPENKFRPYDNISRAEFGTALSRALWGEENNGGTPYYAKHLAALKDAGIMTQISNAESMKEVRGYVMLMLMRSEGTSICDDVVVKVTCAAEAVDGTYKDCPTICRDNGDNNTDTVVKSGDLSVTAKATSSRKVVIGGVSDMDTINLKTSEDSITLTKVTLERYGYSSDKDVANVWLENEDGVAITEPKDLNSKDQVTLNIKKEYRTLSANDVFTIVVETNKTDGTWTQGTTIGFKVTGIESSALNVNLDDYDPYTYDMVTYEGGTIKVEEKGKDTTYHFVSNESYEVAKFKIKGETTTALVNGFVLTNAGDLDLEDWLEDVEVTVDGKAVKSTWNLDDDELTISFNDVEVAQKTSSVFAVNVTLAKDFDDFGDKVNFKLAKSSDLKAIEKKTGSRVKVDPNTAITLYEYTFNGSKITLTNKKLGTVEATAGTTDVVVGEGTIDLGQEVKFNEFYIGATAGVEAMRLIIGGDEFEGTAITKAADIATYCGTADTCWKFKASTDESGKVQFIVDVDDNASADIQFHFNDGTSASFGKNILKDTHGYLGTYDGGKNITTDDLVGSISLSTLKVQPAKGTLENEMTKNYQEFKKGETSSKTIFEGTYTAKKQNIYLNTYVLKGDKKLAAGSDTEITFHIYVNDTEVDADTLSADEQTLTGFFSDVLVKAGETVPVKVVAETYAGDTDNNSYTFELTVSGDNEDGEEGHGEDSDDCVRMDFVGSSSMTISSSSANDVVLKSDGYMELASFILKPGSDDDADADLDEMTFKINNAVTTDTANIRVKIGSSTYSVKKDGTVYSVEDLNETLDSAGLKVIISVKNLAYGDNTVTLVSPKAKTFNKYIVPALVRVTSQTDLDGSTKYVVSVEKYKNGYTVKNIKLGSHTGIAGEFADGDDFEIGGTTTVELISTVSYDVYDEDNTLIGTTPSVSIDKGTYNDYFKVGGSYLRVYKVD